MLDFNTIKATLELNNFTHQGEEVCCGGLKKQSFKHNTNIQVLLKVNANKQVYELYMSNQRIKIGNVESMINDVKKLGL